MSSETGGISARFPRGTTALSNLPMQRQKRRIGSQRRPRWRGPQTTEPAAVLLVSHGGDITKQAVKEAVKLADGERIAVLSISRIYGTAFGLQNPGLYPTKREREEHLGVVNKAIDAVGRMGGRADGQVSTTRHAEKAIAHVASVRGVRFVVVDILARSWLRRVVEGDLCSAIRRRLPPSITVQGIPPP